MFQRVVYENWTTIVPVFSFVLTAGIFIFVTIRALAMPKARRDKMANMPLEENQKPEKSDIK